MEVQLPQKSIPSATWNGRHRSPPQLLRFVEGGEEVVLRNGTVPVARIVPIPPDRGARPKVGEVTPAPVRWSEESFAALNEDGIKRWAYCESAAGFLHADLADE